MSRLDGVPEGLEEAPKTIGPLAIVRAAINQLGWDPLPEVTAKTPLWKVKILHAGRLKKAAERAGVPIADLLDVITWAASTQRTVQNPTGLVYLHRHWRTATGVARNERPLSEEKADLKSQLDAAVAQQQDLLDKGLPAPWMSVLLRARGVDAQRDVLAQYHQERE